MCAVFPAGMIIPYTYLKFHERLFTGGLEIWDFSYFNIVQEIWKDGIHHHQVQDKITPIRSLQRASCKKRSNEKCFEWYNQLYYRYDVTISFDLFESDNIGNFTNFSIILEISILLPKVNIHTLLNIGLKHQAEIVILFMCNLWESSKIIFCLN